MTRDEKTISPHAMLLLKGHERIGYSRGKSDGMFHGCFIGAFGMLVLQLIVSLVLG